MAQFCGVVRVFYKGGGGLEKVPRSFCVFCGGVTLTYTPSSEEVFPPISSPPSIGTYYSIDFSS